MFDKLTLDTKIDDLDISVRAYNVLKNMNIKTVADLIQCTEKQLMRERNFGRRSLNELKFMLAMHGYELGMALPVPDEITVLTERVEELEAALMDLSKKLVQQNANHEKLVKLHNEAARAVARLEDSWAGRPLRDQFAMAALPVAAKAEGRLLSDDIARMAYELADSMMEEREAE